MLLHAAILSAVIYSISVTYEVAFHLVATNQNFSSMYYIYTSPIDSKKSIFEAHELHDNKQLTLLTA